MAVELKKEDQQSSAVYRLNPEELKVHRQILNDLTIGPDYSKINTAKYRGSARFAMLFDANGVPVKYHDIDDDAPRTLVILGDDTWYIVNRLHTEMTKNHTEATKFMVWLWNSEQGKYLPDFSKWSDNGSRIGNEGSIDQYVRRKLGATPSAGLPGMAELNILAKTCADISKEIKKEKKLPEGSKARVVTGMVAFFRGTRTPERDVLALLQKQWPELFQPQHK